MVRSGAITLVFFVAVCAIACSLPRLGAAPIVRFHGEATDPVGDTASIGDARVRRPADLIYASVRVTDDELRFNVRFVPGSFDSATTSVMFLLDTDLDSTTGVPALGIGAEYSVGLEAQPARQATVARAVIDANCPAGPPCRYEPLQHTKIVVSNDAMEVVVSRRVFTQFDGRANVRVVAFAMLDGGRRTATSDHMPNVPARFIEVR